MKDCDNPVQDFNERNMTGVIKRIVSFLLSFQSVNKLASRRVSKTELEKNSKGGDVKEGTSSTAFKE